jgi:hypothetical protein
VRNSDTGSTRSGWRTPGRVAVVAGPNWAAGNQSKRELGDEKTFFFYKKPFILSNLFDSKFKFGLRTIPKCKIK